MLQIQFRFYRGLRTYDLNMHLHLWYKASMLENVTAGVADKLYRLRPSDRGMLPFKRKRAASGLTCHLYELRMVLRVARAVHVARPVAEMPLLRQICVQLGINSEGSYNSLRMSIAAHMACVAKK